MKFQNIADFIFIKVRFLLFPLYLSLLVGSCRETSSFEPISYLEFTDQNSRVFQFKNMENKKLILYFGYSNCPDKCPIALSILSKVLLDLKEVNIYGIFISLDPRRDDPQKLRGFIQRNPNMNLFALTGSESDIQKIGEAFGINSSVQALTSGSYFLDHSNQIILVDKKFQILTRFPGNISIETLKKEIKKLYQLK